MKKLIYLIVAIVALGLIVPGCIPVVPPSEQGVLDMRSYGGTTWYVDDDDYPVQGVGSFDDPFCTIQAAIDAASDYDTIIVAAGTYNENINIYKSLTVVSEDGAEVTIINAQGVPIAVLINGADTVATFDGFTVDNYDM